MKKSKEGKLTELKINHDSEDSLRFLADAAVEGISITRKGKILLVNKALVKMFGYNSKKELLGEFGPNFFAKESRHEVRRRAINNIQGTYQAIGLKKNGQKFYVEIRIKTMILKGEKVRVAIIRDITQEKKIKAALKERIKELRGLYELNNLVDSNKPLKEKLKIFCREIVPKSMQFPKKVFCQINLENKTKVSFRLKEKTNKYLKSSIVVFNKKIGWLKIGYTDKNFEFINFHEKKLVNAYGNKLSRYLERIQVKQYLKESEAKYRNLVETTPGLIFAGDFKGNLNFVNQTIVRELGYKKEELLKLGVFKIIHNDDQKKVIKAQKLIKQGKKVYNIETRIKKKSGKYIYISTNGSPIKDEKGKSVGLLAVARDITERKLIEKNLIKSYKYLGLVNRRLAILLQVKTDNKNKIKLKKAFRVIISSAFSLAEAEICELYSYDKKNKLFKFMISKNKHKFQYDSKIDIFKADILKPSLRQKLIIDKKRIQIKKGELKTDKEIPASLKSEHCLMTPLIIQKKFWGTILIGFKKNYGVTTQDLNFYEIFSVHTSLLLEEILKQNERIK